MQVLDEMNRICGGEESAEERRHREEANATMGDSPGSSGGVSSTSPAAAAAAASFDSTLLSTSPLEPLFDDPSGDPFGETSVSMAAAALMVDPSKVQQAGSNSSLLGSSSSPNTPLSAENEQEEPFFAVAAAPGKQQQQQPQPQPQPHLFPDPASSKSSSSPSHNPSSSVRSRHCSANSSLSFDSAIGDVYSEQTPPGARAASFDFDPDLLDGGGSSGATNKPHKSHNSNSSKVETRDRRSNGGVHLHPEAANVSSPHHRTGLHHHLNHRQHHRKPYDQQQQQQQQQPSQYLNRLPFGTAENRLQAWPSGLHRSGHPSSSSSYPFPGYYHQLPRAAAPSRGGVGGVVYPNGLQQRHEVESVCLDLLRRFHVACAAHPRQLARAWASKSGSDDPLLITTRLLSDALSRLRIFLLDLAPTRWLAAPDRAALYSANVCVVSVLRAAAGADLASLPAAYPLPYGEYLGDVEALHLVLAHDLYNELKGLVGQLQGVVGLRELPVVLLVMMVAFFRVPSSSSSKTSTPPLLQPEKVVRVHDYYTHKLQVILPPSMIQIVYRNRNSFATFPFLRTLTVVYAAVLYVPTVYTYLDTIRICYLLVLSPLICHLENDGC